MTQPKPTGPTNCWMNNDALKAESCQAESTVMTQDELQHGTVAMARFEAHIHGRVQGVGFRYHTVERAESLGLGGYVRNSAHGSVEVVAEGPSAALQSFVAWLRRGPPMARVTRLDLTWQAPRGEFRDFEVRY